MLRFIFHKLAYLGESILSVSPFRNSRELTRRVPADDLLILRTKVPRITLCNAETIKCVVYIYIYINTLLNILYAHKCLRVNRRDILLKERLMPKYLLLTLHYDL